MSAERDELVRIYVETLNEGHGMVSRMVQGNRAADAIRAAGWVKPRTIESAYEDYGPDSLPPLSVVLSGGKPAIRQHDGTWMDYDGSSWDDWEMEYPMTVLHEPS